MNQPMLPLTRTARFLDPDSRTAQLHAQAERLIPGATSRLHYYFKPRPIYAESGSGCRLTDVDGDTRIDCLNNMTALIHGHGDPDVSAAIVEQVARGASFSEPSRPEVDLAALLAQRVPSVEQTHFRSSGTEAVMMAVKLARAYTGRTRIAKFEGGYHGYYDYVQVSFTSSPANWGDAAAPASVPSSTGLSPAVRDEVLVLPFNDRDGVERLLAEHGASLAAVLWEPLSNRSGMATPAPGFLDFLREITTRHGIVLIVDEVIAYRVGPAGAQGLYGLVPDLTTFGKIVGGGLPMGVVGGRADIMGLLDPAMGGRRVMSGGTHSGNPLSAAAGLATLRKLTPDAYAHLAAMGRRMREGINAVFRAAGLPASATGEGSLFQVVPTDRPIRNYRDVPQDAAAMAWMDRLHRELLCAGVIISSRGLSCVSSAMGPADVDEVLGGFERAVDALGRERAC
ncbi:MAG: aspartate aminotransferase family protein [Burkholderiaceae bacterium]|jgi:glutamate-1-semialdehyde 2,1-aminomutase|nr:aspartate aminotransferase family protein [Burkholderiales bacterium]MCZ8336944.1 aspartate aminotransferase family protein [Burkholderiaceae bacterium]